jgi:hypothetical protein
LQAALDGKQASGTYATLVNGLVPSSQLPSFVDDVVDVGGTLPSTGDVGKIYVVSTGANTNKIYRWSGSTFIEISPSPGSTDAVAEGSVNLYHTTLRAAAAAPVQSVAGRTGTITLAQLGSSGTASETTFLRGDGAWAAAGSTNAGDLTSGTLASARLPLATTTAAGAVIVGSGLAITNGVLSRSSSYDPAAAPGAPSGISFNGQQVTWNPSPGGVATYYEVQSVVPPGSYTVLATNVAGTSRTYNYSGGAIFFRVRGYNADNLPGEWGYQEGAPGGSGGGGSGSDDARWDYFKPPAPTNVLATAGNQSAVVTWTPPTGVLAQTPITDQALQFSTNDGSTWTTYAASGAAHLGTSVTGLTNGTPVRFRAAAINGIGQGAWSAASAAVTPSSGVFRAIPAMTGDTSPSGIADLTSSARNPGFVEKWLVFSQGGNVSWAVVNVNLCGGSSVFDAPQYAFPEGQKSLISGYTVGVGGGSWWAGVNNWTFEGSDDLSSWTVLHTVAGQTWGGAWQTTNFSLAAPANYRAYRWKFTGDNSGDCGSRNFAALQLVQ